MSSSSVHIETTHTPQGDGNIGEECRVGVPEETTHTPQGDGNFCAKSCHSPSTPGNNPHPARGRKPAMYTVITPPPRETTHTPQGDGNANKEIKHIEQLETTHTPQGDGNYFINCFIASVVRNNPHPARGRKQLLEGLRYTLRETTHTPQGDGNG